MPAVTKTNKMKEKRAPSKRPSKSATQNPSKPSKPPRVGKPLSTGEVKVFCIFCFRPVNPSDLETPEAKILKKSYSKVLQMVQPKRLKICNKFYDQLSISKENEKRLEGSIISWSGNPAPESGKIYGACNLCFRGIENYCVLFEKIQLLQKQLDSRLDNIYESMKTASAANLRYRKKAFEQSFQTGWDKESDGVDLKTVLEAREKIYSSCKKRRLQSKVDPLPVEMTTDDALERLEIENEDDLFTIVSIKEEDREESGDKLEVPHNKLEVPHDKLEVPHNGPLMMEQSMEVQEDVPVGNASWSNQPSTSGVAEVSKEEPQGLQFQCKETFNCDEGLVKTGHFTPETESYQMKYSKFSESEKTNKLEHERKCDFCSKHFVGVTSIDALKKLLIHYSNDHMPLKEIKSSKPSSSRQSLQESDMGNKMEEETVIKMAVAADKEEDNHSKENNQGTSKNLEEEPSTNSADLIWCWFCNQGLSSKQDLRLHLDKFCHPETGAVP